MFTTILIGLIIILYAAGMYLMAAFVPMIELSAKQQGHTLKTGWKYGLLLFWPVAMIVEALTAGKYND